MHQTDISDELKDLLGLEYENLFSVNNLLPIEFYYWVVFLILKTVYFSDSLFC